jgi:hypothetical protein
MSQNASGSLTLYKLRNGSTTGVALSVDKSLLQIVALDPDGNVSSISPDWSIASNQPTITAVPLLGYTLSDINWYYNGTLITSADSRFLLNPNGSLKIINNLASASNLFTDTIKMMAVSMDSSGNNQGTVEKSIDVQIQRASSNGYTVLINAERTAIDATNPSTVLTAKLLLGATEQSSFTNFKWYKIGSDAQGNITYTQVGTNSATLTVTRDDVTGSQMYLCKAYSTGNVELDAQSITIADVADGYDIYFTTVQGADTQNNIQKFFNVSASSTSVAVKPKLSVNGTEMATGVFWTLEKVHGDTQALIAEISGDEKETTDTDTANSYNTVSNVSQESAAITVFDKDYISLVGTSKRQVEVQVNAIATI